MREQQLVSFRELGVRISKRHDKDFKQRDGGCDDLNRSVFGGLEKRTKESDVFRMLLDEVNERDRIDRDRSVAECFD